MKPGASSQAALLALGGILVLVGGMVASPEGRFLCLVIAGLVACAAVFFGRSRTRQAIACLILAAAFLQAVHAWRPYLDSLDRYRNRESRSDVNGNPE